MEGDLRIKKLMGHMDILSCNLNLNAINFNDDLSIEFEFIDRFGSINEKIVCDNILGLKMEFADTDPFPLFICDARYMEIRSIEKLEQFSSYFQSEIHNLLEKKSIKVLFLDSGDVCIRVLCETFKRLKNV